MDITYVIAQNKELTPSVINGIIGLGLKSPLQVTIEEDIVQSLFDVSRLKLI